MTEAPIPPPSSKTDWRAEHKQRFEQALRGCDEILSKHLGPTTVIRTELRKLLEEVHDRY